MSKDTYSDDKKIEGYKGIDIEANNNINIVSADNISVLSEDALVLSCSLGNAGLSGQSISITSGSSTSMSSAGPITTACTDYTLTAVNYVGVFDTVDISADHDIRMDANESIVLTGDDTATLYSPVLVTVGGGSGSAQTDVVNLQGRDIFVDGSSTTQSHFIVKGANAKLIADENHTALTTYGDYYFVCRKELNSGYIAYIANTANTTSGDAGDILKLDFPNMVNEGSQRSTYIRFEHGVANLRSGSIYLAGSDVPAFRGYVAGTSTTGSNADELSSVAVVSTYPSDSGVVYATGNRDFAEWIECGDIDEWSEYVDVSVAKKDLPNERHTTHLGLPEGFLAYVRSGMFWKEGPGLPMLVTRSAAMLGNSPKNNTTFIGETFSFIGQIRVFVKGPAKSGDYIIPENNYCIAISQESANFEDYKKALGTCIAEKDTDSLGQVLCAIGKK